MNYEDYGGLPADNIVTYAMSAFGQEFQLRKYKCYGLFFHSQCDGVMVEPNSLVLSTIQKWSARKEF